MKPRFIVAAIMVFFSTSLIAEPVSFWVINLKNPNPLIRKSAATNLGVIRDGRAFDPLVEALTDPEPEVRIAAVTALRKLGDLRAIAPVIQLSKNDSDPYVKRIAARAAVQIKTHQEKQEEKKRKMDGRSNLEAGD